MSVGSSEDPDDPGLGTENKTSRDKEESFPYHSTPTRTDLRRPQHLHSVPGVSQTSLGWVRGTVPGNPRVWESVSLVGPYTPGPGRPKSSL